MSGTQTAFEQEFSNSQTDRSPDMLETKLWGNPCPFTFRINYLALLYNTPLYSWVQDTYGLKRPEYVVLYSLALADGGSARDISRTSGFPKNTLSRAIKWLEVMGLIKSRVRAPGGRPQTGAAPFGKRLDAVQRNPAHLRGDGKTDAGSVVRWRTADAV